MIADPTKAVQVFYESPRLWLSSRIYIYIYSSSVNIMRGQTLSSTLLYYHFHINNFEDVL
jgi:hypothetical protein